MNENVATVVDTASATTKFPFFPNFSSHFPLISYQFSLCSETYAGTCKHIE